MASRPTRPNCHWTGKLTYLQRRSISPDYLKKNQKTEKRQEVTEWRDGLVTFPVAERVTTLGLCPQHWNTVAASLSSTPIPTKPPSDSPLAAPGEGPTGRECAGQGPCMLRPSSSCVCVPLLVYTWLCGMHPYLGALVNLSSPTSQERRPLWTCWQVLFWSL